MGLRDWFKNRKQTKEISETSKVDSNAKKKSAKAFVPKVKIEELKQEPAREDILISMKDEIMEDSLSEIYQNRFTEDFIREKYDPESILSSEDITAISCLHGAIKMGNEEEFPNEKNNKINRFLKENPDHIIILIDLMIKDGKREYEQVKQKDAQMIDKLSVTPKTLIPATYTDISTIIDYYQQEKIMENEERE